MDIALWIAQIILAVGLIGAGFNHAMRRDKATGAMAWMLDIPKPALTTIGVLEILAGIGVIVPWATGILPWLTPVAAALVVVLMLLAAVFHLRRPGETQNVAFNVVIAVIAAFVAWGRY